jgi:1-deoxyxylulose-5-phosphate synthase
MQPHYNLLYREEEREMLGLCQAEGIGVLPWSPLARGRLTRPWESQPSTERARTDEYGKGLYGATQEADKAVVDIVGQLSETRGIPRAQIALAWVLHKPAVTAPIVGATKSHHLEDAVGALSVKLSVEEIKSLEKPYIPHPLVGFE